MNVFATTATVTLAALVIAWQPARAVDPEVKRKLVPRAIPGMNRSPASTDASTTLKHRTISAGKPTNQEASQADASTQAHILAVYRRGTFTLPVEAQLENAAAISAQASPASSPELLPPPPGKIKVLSKSEAEKFAKQPSP